MFNAALNRNRHVGSIRCFTLLSIVLMMCDVSISLVDHNLIGRGYVVQSYGLRDEGTIYEEEIDL